MVLWETVWIVLYQYGAEIWCDWRDCAEFFESFRAECDQWCIVWLVYAFGFDSDREAVVFGSERH